MSLITYEFNRADNAGEISQFRSTLPVLQQHYQGKSEVVLYLSGKLNINGVDIDGLIIKDDAIVLVEFKNYSGKINAQVNGDWYNGTKRINGGAKKRDGSFKTVFEQLKINRRALRDGLSHYMKNKDACENIQALVVFTSITKLVMDKDFQWGANAWVNVADVANIAEVLDTIKAKTKDKQSIFITAEDIFDFIRTKGLDERYMMTKYSDFNVLPKDLFHEDYPHNGDDYSPNVLLEKERAENSKNKKALDGAVVLLNEVMDRYSAMTQEKDKIIQQQVELLRIQAEEYESQRVQMEQLQSYNQNQLLKQEEDVLIRDIEVIADKAQKQSTEQPIPNTPEESSPRKRFGMRHKVLKDFNVEIESMDDDQLDLIERNLDKSMIIAGCAGSGKSVIAMSKAQQIIDDGGDVILIAYTKSLCRYMSQSKTNSLNRRFYYHWQWKEQGKPKADYMIVDEIQDFDKEEILEFIDAAKKCFFFFGDSAQSIYNVFGKDTLTVEEISRMTNISVSWLYNNYRLPKPVAKITQQYLGLDEEHDKVPAYSENNYLSKENVLPIFFRCKSRQEQIEKIMFLITTKHLRNVGILVSENEMVLEIMKIFTDANFVCEFKYNAGYNDVRNKDTLNFTTEYPKLMTYHSAKGLQFETVILPYYYGSNTQNECKALYVAMTRTYRNLFILFDGILYPPLSEVPERLYEMK